jgi:hypothetical protein
MRPCTATAQQLAKNQLPQHNEVLSILPVSPVNIDINSLLKMAT